MKENIGRYDIVKGIGIICVVIQHTIGLFDFNSLLANESLGIGTIVGLIMVGIQLIFRNVVMPLFFIISGFGFRPAMNSKAVRKYARFLVKPYIIVGILTSVLHCVIHYGCFRYMKGAVVESLKVLLSFGIVQAQTYTYGDITVYANGPAWFLIVLFLAWMLLSVIYKMTKSDVSRGVFVGVFICVGLVISFVFPALPFGFAQACIATGFLYVGALIKKYDLLEKKLPIVVHVIMIVLSLISIVLGNVDFGYNVWKLGPLDVLGTACFAFFVIKFVSVLNKYDNVFFDMLRKLGGASLWIICIHSIEMIAIPWYLISERYAENVFLGIIIVLVLRTVVLIVGNVGFIQGRKIARRAFR